MNDAAGRGRALIERHTPEAAAILTLRDVSMAFPKPSGEMVTVLAGINMTLRKDEILGLLGLSGSGKSTLLRITDGLVKPTSGSVLFHDTRMDGCAKGIALVFQTFALFPWLTVLENVESGLNALGGLSSSEVRRRSLSAIERIGLNGFEATYPRELSGGMRQRVGFARAFVTDPEVLLMDEPFSALDVLTAETLRTTFLDLWMSGTLSTQAVLLVTHNIEEAVSMCDRILVLASRPACIAAEIPVALAQPRDRLDPAFREIVDDIYSIVASRAFESIARGKAGNARWTEPLSGAGIFAIIGLAELLAAAPHNGTAEVAKIARQHARYLDDVLPIAAALQLLDFAELKENAITLTAAGRMFAHGSPGERQRLFKEHLVHFVPLAAHIRQVLVERPGHRAPRVRFESELEDHLTRRDAQRTLRTVIDWARYADLFAYDDKTRSFSLSNLAPGSGI